jgi:hypothetical protein
MTYLIQQKAAFVNRSGTVEIADLEFFGYQQIREERKVALRFDDEGNPTEWASASVPLYWKCVIPVQEQLTEDRYAALVITTRDAVHTFGDVIRKGYDDVLCNTAVFYAGVRYVGEDNMRQKMINKYDPLPGVDYSAITREIVG